jgi:hypothetical protein
MSLDQNQIEEQIKSYPDEYKSLVFDLLKQASEKTKLITWLKGEIKAQEALVKEKDEKLQDVTRKLVDAERNNQ